MRLIRRNGANWVGLVIGFCRGGVGGECRGGTCGVGLFEGASLLGGCRVTLR